MSTRSDILRRFFLGTPDRSGFLERLGLGILIAAVLMGVYQIVGREVTPLPWSLETPLDRAIPFLPWTAWFYVVVYAFVFLIPLTVMDERPVYARAAAALLITGPPCWIIHALVPIAYPRPPAPTGPGWSDTLMRLVYLADPPQNTFPSMHVALAWVLVIVTWKHQRLAGALTAVCATLMTVSVLTTKQHFLADIAGGWAMSLLAWTVLQRLPIGQLRTVPPPREPTG